MRVRFLVALVCVVSFAAVATAGPVLDWINAKRPGWVIPKPTNPSPSPSPAPEAAFKVLPVGPASNVSADPRGCANGKCPLQK